MSTIKQYSTYNWKIYDMVWRFFGRGPKLSVQERARLANRLAPGEVGVTAAIENSYGAAIEAAKSGNAQKAARLFRQFVNTPDTIWKTKDYRWVRIDAIDAGTSGNPIYQEHNPDLPFGRSYVLKERTNKLRASEEALVHIPNRLPGWAAEEFYLEERVFGPNLYDVLFACNEAATPETEVVKRSLLDELVQDYWSFYKTLNASKCSFKTSDVRNVVSSSLTKLVGENKTYKQSIDRVATVCASVPQMPQVDLWGQNICIDGLAIGISPGTIADMTKTLVEKITCSELTSEDVVAARRHFDFDRIERGVPIGYELIKLLEIDYAYPEDCSLSSEAITSVLPSTVISEEQIAAVRIYSHCRLAQNFQSLQYSSRIEPERAYEKHAKIHKNRTIDLLSAYSL